MVANCSVISLKRNGKDFPYVADIFSMTMATYVANMGSVACAMLMSNISGEENDSHCLGTTSSNSSSNESSPTSVSKLTTSPEASISFIKLERRA